MRAMTSWVEHIDREASKLIRRFETYARSMSDEHRRRVRRTTVLVPQPTLKRPAYWGLADGFDPYITRARAERIGHAVRNKIRQRTFVPRNPVIYTVPKVGDGTRNVSVFQVADNAVSRCIFESLMSKNRTLLSSRAYAYRADISAHDAIQYVTSELRGLPRVFVAEYDFSKYFDNISHDHIWRTLCDRGFLLTEAEESIIRGFLAAPAQYIQTYAETGGAPREKGVPQGTSISLFLANVAAWDLDRTLERLGVSFVRYADDTLIWSPDYKQICAAAETLHEMSEKIGAPLNLEKSGGIRLLVRPGAPAEMRTTEHVDYLGHRVTVTTLKIKPTVIAKMCNRINRLIYYNLVREPLLRAQAITRLARVDTDYATLIWQLRRYMYGDINERGLRRFEARGAPARRFRGVLAFFPLVDDEEQLRALDKWLLCQIYLALRKRGRLLRTLGVTQLPVPHGLSCDKLARFTRQSQTTGGVLDLRVPSFWRIARRDSEGSAASRCQPCRTRDQIRVSVTG